MKKFFYSLLFAASALLWTACQEQKGPEGGEDTSDYYEFPLNVKKGSFQASENGVSVNVTSLTEQNIIFEAKPGLAINSYRVDVYPKALLYNFLLEEDCYQTPRENCEDKIIELMMSSTTGASQTVFNTASDDYDCKEFDWANTTLTEAVIVPDCDYYIMILGCYDDDATNPASLTLCEVTTKHKQVIGSPRIDIEAITGHTAFIVKYHPNEDCKYFYHWIWSTDEIGEFIDIFGDRMMRDFCRTYSMCYDASLEENLAIKRTFGTASEVNPKNTAVAVAVDANLTPTAVIVRNDFELIAKPTGDFKPKAEVYAGDRIGATMSYITAWMDKTCESCFYRVYLKDDAESVKGLSDGEKTDLAYNITSEGYGVANRRFGYDSDLQSLTGSEYTETDNVQFDLLPDTEYVVVSVAKNRFGELSDLYFSDPFRTKVLKRNSPEECLADVNLTITEISRWGFTYNFSYDFSKTMCYRFQIVWPYDEDDPTTSEDDDMIRPPHYINDVNDREKWMTFFYDTYQEGPAGYVPMVNLWNAEPSGVDGLAMFGYESGVEYVIAYCAEDVNGVAGPVKFVTVKTTEPNPGPNPTVAIENLTYDAATGAISARIRANEDSKSICYFIVGPNDGTIYSDCALGYLAATKRTTYDEYMSVWKAQLIQNGLTTSAEAATVSSYASASSEAPVLIAAVSIGEENQEDVYSPVAAKIFYKGEFKDLSFFRTQE